MKRYMAFIVILATLWGCTSNAPAPTVVADPTTAETTAATTSSTEETPAPTAPAETIPVVVGFDPAQIANGMSLEEKVGQLFLARCPGDTAVEEVQKYHLGGYILFAPDIRDETKDSLTEKIAAYQAASAIPMLIAVDEEGGTVCRVSQYSAFRSGKFLSPRQLYGKGGLELILSTEEEKCLLLKGLGINVNMAPVCDITTKSGAFMFSRSLGQSPEITGDFASGVCSVIASYNMGSVLKHFPGYGNNADTHTGIARDKRTLAELENYDLIPFAMAIENGCDAILISHTIVECLDAEYPASLSPAVHRYLRSEMVFGGVIITDDLYMQAIKDLYGDGEVAVLAVLAGNDLLCVTNYAVQYEAVLAAVKEGRIPMQQIDTAVERILRWKYRLGLFENELSGDLT